MLNVLIPLIRVLGIMLKDKFLYFSQVGRIDVNQDSDNTGLTLEITGKGMFADSIQVDLGDVENY